jgi:hypothetical protein
MNIVEAIVKNTFYQLFFTVGLMAVFGLVVGLMNKAFYKLVGYKFGRIVCIVTGFIGTPIHEIGHTLFCLIFGHKIVEVKLYQPNNADGTLGYVNHTYNRKSIYHQIGNFFIGFGPILFGSVVLLLLMFLLVPNLYGAFTNSLSLSDLTLRNIFDLMRRALFAFYSSSELSNWRWWGFIIPACSIALHMSLSVADMKASWVGFGFIVAMLLIANTTLYFIKIDTILTLTGYCLTAGAFILNFLTISIIFSLILFLLGAIVRGIRKIKGR